MSVRLISDVEVASAALAAGFHQSEIPVAVAVALAESGTKQNFLAKEVLVNTLAVGVNKGGTAPGSEDLGAWQINSYWQADKLAKGDWRNPLDNARMARAVYNEAAKAGRDPWSPWATYNHGSHLKYMARGGAAAASITRKSPTFARELFYKGHSPYMRGEDVKALQGLLGLRSTGVFEEQTRDAVVVAQKRLRLSVDGVAGKYTVTALGGRWIG